MKPVWSRKAGVASGSSEGHERLTLRFSRSFSPQEEFSLALAPAGLSLESPLSSTRLALKKAVPNAPPPRPYASGSALAAIRSPWPCAVVSVSSIPEQHYPATLPRLSSNPFNRPNAKLLTTLQSNEIRRNCPGESNKAANEPSCVIFFT